jgi:hypothetical protein
LSIAKDILTIIGCNRPEVQIKMGAAFGRVKKDALQNADPPCPI